MRINRVLNNNVVVVKEGDEEIIVMGSGIAFGKRKNDIISTDKIEKVFVMKDEREYEKFTQIIDQLPEAHIILAEEIITQAENELKTKLNEHIHVALTDHISFAIERFKQGYQIHNKLLNEIRVLYSTEFEIGLWAIRHIEKQIGIRLPEDEAGHIALHLHTAKVNSTSMNQAINTTALLNELIELIEEKLDVKVEQESISYQRLLTHLNFALRRVAEGEAFQDVDEDMHQLVKEKHHIAYNVAVELANYLAEVHQYDLPPSELVYLTLHIQRIQRTKIDEVGQ
ncbi:PRD domain-containing protein [Halalkalibacter krulwichiae]|uniref:Levansucrase and sucrase synthesis operon antiterminator n=1 Tax=Halalkalibacter krulwichiae TaxID=199441 RepID=A0A1X9MBD4_9BACI|nr:PRD domain-containing protein [Halalkalibacter krulwichiae]ARK29473.1 Levansucrase and sucrase synthesis operon antiterminator [Halalkalibacter krulwichiae]